MLWSHTSAFYLLSKAPVSLLSTLLVSYALQISVLAQAEPRSWRQQTIYLVFPDRFQNGNSANDKMGVASCYDPSHPKRFHGGDLAGLRQRIGYLNNLGVTAVWSTPVYKQIGFNNGACGYHGYWPDFTFPNDGALEPKLGTPAEFTNLLKELRANNIKFIMDMVINHSGPGARLTTQKPTWFRKKGKPACFQPQGSNGPQLSEDIYCQLLDLPDLAQENSEVSNYLVEQSKSIVGQYPIDGIRMDTVKHVETSYFQNTWIPTVRNERENLFLVGEALYNKHTDPVSKLTPYVKAGFDSMFNFPLRAALEETFAKGKSVDLVADKVQETAREFGSQSLMMTNLLDNHDMPRFLNQIKSAVGSVNNPANVTQIRQRYHLALAMLFTLPGIPQIYYGNEIGMFGGEDPDNRRDMPSWAWTITGRLQNPSGQGFLPSAQTTFSYVQKLSQLRKNNPALFNGYYAEMYRQNGSSNPDIYAFFRGHLNNRIIIVVNNGTLTSGRVSIPVKINNGIESIDQAALSNGTIIEDLLQVGAPSKIAITNGVFTVDMPSKTVGIYRVKSP